MTATHPADRLRRPLPAPSLHTYFDVSPESPDGRHLVCFVADGPPLTAGTVTITGLDGSDSVRVAHCRGTAHGAAQQGWLDPGHVYYTANGEVRIVDLRGRQVQCCPGSIDTLHQASRRGLVTSNGLRKTGATAPHEQACYRVDLDSGRLEPLAERAAFLALLAEHLDLSQVPAETCYLQHSKWSPDGRRWLVVLSNEVVRRTQPDLPRVKALFTLDDQGGDLRFIDRFNHHPNWLPDGSGVYAFADDGPHAVVAWGARGGNRRRLASLPCEGHPSLNPDGRLLACDSQRYPGPGRAGVILHDLDTGVCRDLAVWDFPVVPWQQGHVPGQVCHAHPVWSPDGRRLYLNTVDGDLPRLAVWDRPQEPA